MEKPNKSYPVSFEVDYPDQRNRLETLTRIIWVIPILTILSLLDGGWTLDHASRSGGGVVIGLAMATALMIVFQEKYPRWWFDFALELNRFEARVGAYIFLLTDQYPSTTDKQSIKLDIKYPDVKKDLNNLLPLVKWLLAIPHYICLAVLLAAAVVATVIAWFSIILTGRHPRGLYDFVVGVFRWFTRVNAYAFLLTTDQYPPFSLK